jgi:Regulator of ribonuclease activity B
MSIYDYIKYFFSRKERFVSTLELEQNKLYQNDMTLKMLSELEKQGITNKNVLKLEFYFRTNSIAKAESLSDELKKINYTTHFNRNSENNISILITGWTDEIPINEKTVQQWTIKMCDIGFQADCDFEGWEAYTEIEET